jgi:hypothetical protein
MRKFLKVFTFTILLPLSIAVPVNIAQTITLDSHIYAQANTMQKRIDAYKQKLTTSPGQSDLNRLKLRCSGVQNVLGGVNTRSTNAQKKRTEAYTKINTTLDELTKVLKEQNIETTKLETQSKELRAKTDAFAKTQAAFTTAVKDAAEIKCDQDPLALRAAIQEARNLQSQLLTQAADIRTYVTNVLKPTLKQLRAELVSTTKPVTTTPQTEEETPNAAQ